MAEILRAFSLTGLGGVGKADVSFRGWIGNSNFKISEKITSKKFELDIYEHNQILIPFAFDINRMASSSFESIESIKQVDKFPKSAGWLIIQLYYSAYFSAHAILRLFGITCSQFDSKESIKITEIAKLYECSEGITVSSGYYSCKYQSENSLLKCSHLGNTHQDVWREFYLLLGDLANKALTSDFLQEDRDRAIDFLYELRNLISNNSKMDSGSWLSKIRNEVNYTHSMGVWFPYSGANNEYEKMFRSVGLWKNSLSSFNFDQDKSDHIRFVESCVLIVSLCRSLIIEVNKNQDRNFLSFGAIRLLNQISA